MSIPHRIKAKFFVDDPAAVDLPAFIPVFHRWIQERQTDELMIDVTDYKHVQDGPGIILIGHEADYAMDMGGGRPGLLYTRKRKSEKSDGSVADRLRTVLHSALRGCQAIESDSSLEGKISFGLNEVELSFSDKLLTANGSAAYDALQAHIQTVVDELYDGIETTLSPVTTDARRPLTVRIQAKGAPDLAALLGRLEQKTAGHRVYTNGHVAGR